MRQALLFLLLALAACDSAGPPTPPPVVSPPVVPPPVVPPPALMRFALPEVPAGLSYEVTEQATVTPRSFFGTGAVPSDLYFTAVSTGPGVTVQTTRTTVTVVAVAEGVTPVAVTFSAAGYRDSTVTVPVSVGPATCPDAAPAGARDYFPASAGTAWALGYGSNEFVGGVPVEIINATLTLTFGAPTCLRGIRSWAVTQRLAGTRRSSTLGTPTPYSSQATATVTEGAQNEVSFSLVVPAGLTHSVAFRRYRVAPGGGTLGAAGTTGCVTGSYAPLMTFDPGVGLTYESMSCTTPAGVLERFMTRVP